MNPSISNLNWVKKVITLFVTVFLLNKTGFSLPKPIIQTTGSAISGQKIAKSNQTSEERVQVDNIIAELRRTNLISNKNKLSLRITNESLFVNGVKQSKELHQRILRKYVKNPNQKLTYTYTTSVNVN